MADTDTAPDASKPAKKQNLNERFWGEVRGYAEALAIAFVVVTFGFNTVGVVGSSMRPNLDGGVGSSNILQSLMTGDRVFIPKYETWLRRLSLLGEYERGDIVVVRQPENAPHSQLQTSCFFLADIFYDCRPFFIKRVIGVPGDHLRLEGGQVFINDTPVDQSFITASGEVQPEPVDFPVVTQRDGQVDGFSIGFDTINGVALPQQLPLNFFRPEPLPITDPAVQLYYGSTVETLKPVPDDAPEGEPFILDVVIPENHYFVMGDNRAEGGSEDSKYFGPVPSIAIAGRASAVIWPPRRGEAWNWRSLPPPSAFDTLPGAP